MFLNSNQINTQMSTVRLRKTFIFFLVIFGCSKEDSPVDNTPNQITYELSVSSSDGGSVDISGGTYNQNSEVTITATPAPGYAFSGWSGNATGSPSLPPPTPSPSRRGPGEERRRARRQLP